MKFIRRLLTRPLRRARSFRGNDEAQVMVLTAVMVFVIMIFAINNLNTASAIFNRMQTQHAADAAADSFAAWQARGLNLAQHVNDVHWTLNIALYVGQKANCVARVGCVLLNLIPLKGQALYVKCCKITAVIYTTIETIQATGQQAAHLFQEGLNIVIPFIGWLSANTLAEANGADPILGAVLQRVEQLASALGAPRAVSGMLSRVGNMLGHIPIYAVPVDFTHFKIPGVGGDGLGIKIRGGASNATRYGTPMSPPWYFSPALAQTCRMACPFARGECLGDSANPNNPLAIIMNKRQCGWEDSYFYGFVGYNTWIVARNSVNIIGSYEKLPWLNPERRGDAAAQQAQGLYHKTFDQVSGEFRNPAFIAIASSQPYGHTDIKKQPVVERSIGVSGFEYHQAQLISVHFGKNPPSDSIPTALFIWH